MLNRIVVDGDKASPGLPASSAARFACGPVVARVSRWRLIAALQVGEALAVAASADIWLSNVLAEEGAQAGPFEMVRFAFAVALVVHFVLRSLGAYDFAGILNVWRSGLTAVAAWMLATAPLFFWVVKLEPLGTRWQQCFLDWLAGGLLIVLVRLGAAYAGTALLLARRLSHNVAIIGAGPEAQRCAELLKADRSGANVIDFIPLANDDQGQPNTAWRASVIAQLQRLIQINHVKDVIVASSPRDRDQLTDLVNGLLCLPVRVLLWPRSIGVEAEWIASSECKIGDMPLLVASAPPLDGWHWVLKDVQDRILAFLLLMICSPVLLTIAALIRLSSPGPILFRQEREGYNGNKFVIFKFRTMNVAPSDTARLILTERRDPRVFPLGRFLRKSSLDELPQLLNVLRGDMWLVGPRPHSPLATAEGHLYPAAAKQYMARFRVKPGITGWAQVNGWRGATNTLEQIQQRVAHDLYYIDHWSVWLDFQILLQTAFTGSVHKNAY